jgi:(R,R)-butanediol dehydrogenase/meso-butanediol dehydrogenase/diacetyl reductase
MATETRPVPVPGPGQVLVEVDHCGICGSDIHLIWEGWGSPGSVFGHEWSGTVADVGPGVQNWAPGDRVVGGPSPRCGRCRRCLEGKPSQCANREGDVMSGGDGAFAHYLLARASSLLGLPEGLSSRDAALAEPLAVALHGITRAALAPEDTVMVFGAGPIGALSVAVLVHQGVREVTVVEPAASRRALAKKLGAKEVIEPDVLETFPRWEPERIAARAVDVVLECSGKKAAMETGLCQLRRGGTLVLVGAGNQIMELDPNRMLLNELQMCGSFVYDADGFERALELLSSGAIATDVLIEPTDVTLEGIGPALEGLATGQMAGKAMVVPRATAGAGR